MAADPQRALRLMGLCRRAGSLVIGMGALKAALQRGDVRLLVLAGDAAPGSVRRARTAAESAGIPAVVLSDRGSLGSALGREWVAVLIFFLISMVITSLLRKIKILGLIPKLISSLYECWVGLVFNSLLPGTVGTKVVCTKRTSSFLFSA